MARLDKKPYPGDWGQKPDEDFDAYLKRIEKLEEELPWSQIMTFPVADGKACYFVKSEKPLVLQHIPIGDAYRIPDAHIRGLRLEDWEKQKAYNKMFLHSNLSLWPKP